MIHLLFSWCTLRCLFTLYIKQNLCQLCRIGLFSHKINQDIRIVADKRD